MTYRWNVSSAAQGYDAAAALIHPHYEELQDELIRLLPIAREGTGLVVDLGGGSGRLAEKLLERFPKIDVVVVDQSEPFLALAERRMERFADRGRCVQSRLQDHWENSLPRPPNALVSMSAIHHLEPAEKQSLYRRCFDALAPGGVLLNGDEVRPANDAEYLALLQDWAAHMRRLIAGRLLPEAMHNVLEQWVHRNVDRFGEPRHSGDDCHETIAAQLDYFTRAGFAIADISWHREMWAVLRGVKG